MHASVNIVHTSFDLQGLVAVLSPNTHLAKIKGRIKRNYPIEVNGVTYIDVNEAFNSLFVGDKNKDILLMTDILIKKFDAYPILFDKVWELGGIEWLATCRHIKNDQWKSCFWQGFGKESNYVNCLISAYRATDIAIAQYEKEDEGMSDPHFDRYEFH